MMWEYYAGTVIILFAVCQLIMAALNVFAYPKVKAWKTRLSISQSMWAKSALIIFF